MNNLLAAQKPVLLVNEIKENRYTTSIQTVTNAMKQNQQVIVIDCTGTYAVLADKLEGQYIPLHERFIINPLHYKTHHPYQTVEERCAFVVSYVEFSYGAPYTSDEKVTLYALIKNLYASFGIEDGKTYTHPIKMPTLRDLASVLCSTERFREIGMFLESKSYDDASMFQGQSNVMVTPAPLVVFDLHQLDKMQQEEAIFLINDYLKGYLRTFEPASNS